VDSLCDLKDPHDYEVVFGSRLQGRLRLKLSTAIKKLLASLDHSHAGAASQNYSILEMCSPEPCSDPGARVINLDLSPIPMELPDFVDGDMPDVEMEGGMHTLRSAASRWLQIHNRIPALSLRIQATKPKESA
jgi:hypothetical protein